MKVFHLVGWNGSGKSSLASRIVAAVRSRGQQAVHVDVEEVLGLPDVEALQRQHAAADLLIIEHYPSRAPVAASDQFVFVLPEQGESAFAAALQGVAS